MRKILILFAAVVTLAGCASSEQMAIMKENRDKAELTPQLRAMIAQKVFATDHKRLMQLSPSALAAQPIKEAVISNVQSDRDIFGGGTLMPFYCVTIWRKTNYLWNLLYDFDRTYKVVLIPIAAGEYVVRIYWKEGAGPSSDTCSMTAERPFPELVQLERSSEGAVSPSKTPDSSAPSH